MTKQTIEMQQQTEELMRYLGKILDDAISEFFPQAGFALIIFKFHEEGLSNYISNAERGSMIKALKEIAERLEKNEDIPAGLGGIH